MGVHVEREDIDGVTVLRLSGEINNAEEFRESVSDLLNAGLSSKVVLNLLSVTNISSLQNDIRWFQLTLLKQRVVLALTYPGAHDRPLLVWEIMKLDFPAPPRSFDAPNWTTGTSAA